MPEVSIVERARLPPHCLDMSKKPGEPSFGFTLPPCFLGKPFLPICVLYTRAGTLLRNRRTPSGSQIAFLETESKREGNV